MSITAQLHYLINGERSPMLARYPGMDAYAQDWAEQMAGADVLEHSDGLYSGEVIASGATTASQAIALWKTSPAHWDIITNDAYRMVGIGYSDGYWCVVFS